MAWDGKILPDAFLTSALAAVAAAQNGSKDNAFMAHIQAGIGTSWKRQFLRDDIVVFEGTGTGLIPYTGRTFTVPGVTKTSITSADLDTGEWIHRIINASDSTKYIAGKVTLTGGAGPGFLTGDLVSPNNVNWSTFEVYGPQFDTTNQSWINMLADSMKQGDLFDINSQPGGGSVAANGGPVQFGGSYAKGVSTAGIRDSVFAGTGSYAFGNGIGSIPFWAWMYAGFGNTDNTAELEYRRGFCQIRRKSTKQWEFLYRGARMFGHETYNYPGNGGNVGNQIKNYTANSSKCKPFGGTGYEVWPEPSATNPEVESFHGKTDYVALQDFDCVCVGFQVRIINREAGKNPVFLGNIGWDIFRPGVNPRYDAAGYPYGAYDGGGGRWRLLPKNGDWMWVVAIGCHELGQSTVAPPPWGNYNTPWLYASPPNYGISWAEIQSNPPIDVPPLYPPDVVTTTYRILPIGDSLTAGNDGVSGGYRTWRGAFQSLAANAGLSIDMIGPNQNTPASGGQDPDHAAWGGAYINDAGVGAINASNNLTARNSVIFDAAYQPDIIVLYPGWNDVYNQPGTIADRYETYYNNVRSQRPNAKVMMVTLQPQRGETEAQTNAALAAYAAVNTRIRALAAANASTSGVAEVAQGAYQFADYFDVIHMAQAGASKQAQIIFDAIRAKGWM